MNSYIRAITSLDAAKVRDLIARRPSWLTWSEPSGKNALHYLCGTSVDDESSKVSLTILKLLLNNGVDINSVHRIPDEPCEFSATPLWYAYAKGRNKSLYKYLLKRGADPANCWWAIAWNDDIGSAKLWLKHGAVLGDHPTKNDLFVGAYSCKKFAFADWMLAQEADINSLGPNGETALMFAVKRKDEAEIRRLLGLGAAPGIGNAREVAAKQGSKRILELLPGTS